MKNVQTLRDVIQEFVLMEESCALSFFDEQQAVHHSYSQLFNDVKALSSGLWKRGINAGDRIAILSPNSYEWIVTALAVIGAGGILVPVDVQNDWETLRHILSDSEARLIFTTVDQYDRLKAEDRNGLEYVLLNNDLPEETQKYSWKLLMDDRESFFPDIKSDDVAVLFYTSGTTGRPKGVPLTHGQLVFQIITLDRQKLLQDHEKILLPLPLHHVYPFVVGLLFPLAFGHHILFPYALTGPQIIRVLKEGAVTVVIGVPRLFRALVEGIESRVSSKGKTARIVYQGLYFVNRVMLRAGIFPGKKSLSFLHRQIGPDLRMLACGGAALSASLYEKLHALGWRVGIGYGLTETAPLLTIQKPGDYRPGSVGNVIEGVTLRLDQLDHQKSGQVVVRGPNVFRGYWHLREETQEAFTQDGWFKTGDMGFVEDGYLYLTGRVSTLIVTESGKNIQPDQVEDALMKDPLIKEAGVFQKENRIVGIIVPEKTEVSKQQGDPVEQVRRAVEEKINQLPSYQRLDDVVISNELLPRTRLGKIRRHLLAEIFERNKGGEKRGQKESGVIAIQEMSDQDQILLENQDARKVWDWLVLEYGEDRRLTPDTNLQLELGIDSMEWINISMEVRLKTGREISESAIADIDTVRDLLREVAEKASLSGEDKEDILLEYPQALISEEQKKWLRPHNPAQRLLSGSLNVLNNILMKLLFRVHADGLENIPKEGPYIIAPNHISYLDPFVLAVVLQFRQLENIYWAGWTGIAFRNAAARAFSRLARVIPIDPRKGAISSLAFVLAVLKRKQNIIIFPEGQRAHSDDLIPFKPGLGMVLNYVDVPIVPVIISGTYQAWPAHQRFPKPHPVEVFFWKTDHCSAIKRKSRGINRAVEIDGRVVRYDETT